MYKYHFLLLFYQVPSDIEVASAQTPKNIDLVAKEVGLLPSEVDLYGKKKAKVALSTLERLKDRKNGKYVIVAGEIWFKLNQNDSSSIPKFTTFSSCLIPLQVSHQLLLEKAKVQQQLGYLKLLELI